MSGLLSNLTYRRLTIFTIFGLLFLAPPIIAFLFFTQAFTYNLWLTLILTAIYESLVVIFAWQNQQNFAIRPPRKKIALYNLKLLSIFRIGNTESISAVAWSPDGSLLACSHNNIIRIWSVATEKTIHILKGHGILGYNLAWSPNGSLLASTSTDRTIRLWNPTTGQLVHSLENYAVTSIAWSPDSSLLAFASTDRTIRLWNPTTGQLVHSLESYTNFVNAVAWSPDGSLLATASNDHTIRLWNPTTGQLVRSLQSHAYAVSSVVWSSDGSLLASIDSSRSSNTVFIWLASTGDVLSRLTQINPQNFYLAWHPRQPLLVTPGQNTPDICIWQVRLPRVELPLLSTNRVEIAPLVMSQYVNAKVVLVGDSGVGKSGLGLVLSEQPFEATESTHGRRVWTFDTQEVPLDERRKETRETLLWDLAGQPTYRLIHQLYLNEVTVALVVFDGRSDTDPFAGVRHWDTALLQAQRIQGSSALPLKKFLVAARIDRGGIGVSRERMQALVRELGFDGYFETSAKEGWHIPELRSAIREAVNWEELPKVNSSVLFQQMKQFLVAEKKQGTQLISTVDGLYRTFLHFKEAPAETEELRAQFETCIRLIESAGLIKRLSFGDLVLLQPEYLDAYASALVITARDEPDGLGSIAEEEARTGRFKIPKDERISNKEQEKLLLIAMVEDLLRRELVLREENMLIFPSQSTKDNPEMPDPKGKSVVFEFQGAILNIYTTLAVRLARSETFKKKELWKNAIIYTSSVGGTYGLFLQSPDEGRGKLTLFFDEHASRDMKRIFEEYIQAHLLRHALSDGFNIRHVIACASCGEIISAGTIQRRRERNFDWLNCPVCGSRISLVESDTRSVPATTVADMDRAADKQRDREAAKSVLEGKIKTDDFDVFLCHHGIDKPEVKQIGEQLKQQGILPWLDEWELRPGMPWQELLEEQIEKIKAAAVFVGKDGRGPWQDRELRAFLSEFTKRKCPVIPVILPDCQQAPQIPLFLQEMTWVDFRQQEPDPMQQLLWGITGERDRLRRF